MTLDPRLSDEATGLPPLEELGDDETLLALAWATGEGIVSSPNTAADGVVRYLHLRGLAVSPDDGVTVEWVQAHIAIPIEVLGEIVGMLQAWL